MVTKPSSAFFQGQNPCLLTSTSRIIITYLEALGKHSVLFYRLSVGGGNTEKAELIP